MSITRTLRAGLAALLGTGLVLTGTVAAGATSHPDVVRTLKIHQGGKHIVLHRGQEVKLDLYTSVDGGYGWSFQRRPDAQQLRVVAHHVVAYPHPAHAVGYPYHTVYRLRAEGAGTTTLTLAETQGGRDTAHRFRLTVRVP